MPDASGTLFSSSFNYQKIFDNDSSTVNVPGLSGTAQETISHNLGYIPTARVFYEPEPGNLWPLNGQQYLNSGGGPDETVNVTAEAYVTTTQLVIDFENVGSSSQNVTYYWRIYYDE